MRIVLASLLVAGCALPGTGSSDDAGDDTTGGAPAVARGTYTVTSDIDLTVEALLPEPAETVVVTLRDFAANPARTLFDLADDAGVPAVGTIRDALPSYVEDKLYGWIDGYIANLTLDGTPITEVAGDIAALAQTSLTHVALASELTVGTTSATHTLTALDFAPAGIDARIAFDPALGDILTASATYRATASTATLGDHGFAIAYGAYVWAALDGALVATYGVGARDAIQAAVDCPALAHAIAQKCYLGVCVGHEAELTAICTAGVDEVIERAYARIAAERFDLVHFAAGTATLVDANRDLDAEQLAGGVWTAEINAGVGLRPVPATFVARR